MTQLSANEPRTYELGIPPIYNDVPCLNAVVVYAGACVGESSSTGNARQLEDGDAFLGFATAKCDNTSGAVGDKNVRVRSQGLVKLAVGGTLTDDDLGAAVYATDSNTFSKTDSGTDTQIGKIHRFIDASTAIVHFQAYNIRSV